MKPRTIRRLELMAAAAAVKMREDLLRHKKVLGQIEYQQGVLADYRARLKDTWRHGDVISAGQALRAEIYVAASNEAGEKIEAEAARTRLMLDEALQALARNQDKRRGLAQARQRALAADERQIERRLELAANWRRKAGKTEEGEE